MLNDQTPDFERSKQIQYLQRHIYKKNMSEDDNLRDLKNDNEILDDKSCVLYIDQKMLKLLKTRSYNAKLFLAFLEANTSRTNLQGEQYTYSLKDLVALNTAVPIVNKSPAFFELSEGVIQGRIVRVSEVSSGNVEHSVKLPKLNLKWGIQNRSYGIGVSRPQRKVQSQVTSGPIRRSNVAKGESADQTRSSQQNYHAQYVSMDADQLLENLEQDHHEQLAEQTVYHKVLSCQPPVGKRPPKMFRRFKDDPLLNWEPPAHCRIGRVPSVSEDEQPQEPPKLAEEPQKPQQATPAPESDENAQNFP